MHLITRAQGGLHDYQAFMHEAGHALHYAGVDPRLPYTFREHLARPRADGDLLVHLRGDHARARLARADFGLSDAQAAENAEATMFLEALLYRRYTAKLRYELGFWSSFARGRRHAPRDYSTLLTEATGIRYDPRNYLADMDAGFYSADYLRAWIRSAQLRAYLDARGRRGLVADREDGRASCASCSPRARSRRARRSPRGSASSRSTPARSSAISPTRSARRAAGTRRAAAARRAMPRPHA